MADRMRKIQLNNEQLQTDLNIEKSSVVKMEGHRSMLERQNKELKSKLAELETEIRSKTKSTIAALESKVGKLYPLIRMNIIKLISIMLVIFLPSVCLFTSIRVVHRKSNGFFTCPHCRINTWPKSKGPGIESHWL